MLARVVIGGLVALTVATATPAAFAETRVSGSFDRGPGSLYELVVRVQNASTAGEVFDRISANLKHPDGNPTNATVAGGACETFPPIEDRGIGGAVECHLDPPLQPGQHKDITFSTSERYPDGGGAVAVGSTPFVEGQGRDGGSAELTGPGAAAEDPPKEEPPPADEGPPGADDSPPSALDRLLGMLDSLDEALDSEPGSEGFEGAVAGAAGRKVRFYLSAFKEERLFGCDAGLLIFGLDGLDAHLARAIERTGAGPAAEAEDARRAARRAARRLRAFIRECPGAGESERELAGQIRTQAQRALAHLEPGRTDLDRARDAARDVHRSKLKLLKGQKLLGCEAARFYKLISAIDTNLEKAFIREKKRFVKKARKLTKKLIKRYRNAPCGENVPR